MQKQDMLQHVVCLDLGFQLKHDFNSSFNSHNLTHGRAESETTVCTSTFLALYSDTFFQLVKYICVIDCISGVVSETAPVQCRGEGEMDIFLRLYLGF
jgi:hypothetical protein